MKVVFFYHTSSDAYNSGDTRSKYMVIILTGCEIRGCNDILMVIYSSSELKERDHIGNDTNQL